jgi:hypothetical protein
MRPTSCVMLKIIKWHKGDKLRAIHMSNLKHLQNYEIFCRKFYS